MKHKFNAAISAILLAVCLCFPFAGCGGEKDDDASSQPGNSGTVQPGAGGSILPSPGGGILPGPGGNIQPGQNNGVDFEMPLGGFDATKPVTITFYHTMSPALRAVLDSALEEFYELYPNITVDHKQIGDYDAVRDQIISEINAGRQPNLAYCYPDHVATFNTSKAVQPLNDFLADGAYNDVKVTRADGTEVPLNMTAQEQANFIDGYWEEGWQFDDDSKMYTLPFSKSTEVLYYNADFFRDNNLTVPTTWDEMEEVCEQIKEIAPDDFAFGYDSESNWFINMCEQSGKNLYTSSTGTKYLFDNETTRAFVQRFKGWYDQGYFTTRALYSGKYASTLFTATSGVKCYMCIASSTGANYLFANDAFEVGIAPIPQVDPEHPKVISQGPSLCIFKNDNPQEVLASWLLAKFLTTNIAFQAQFATTADYIPVLEQEVMLTNATYADLLAKADGVNNIAALSQKVCLQQQDAYFTPPAFPGSSLARDQVGILMQAVLGGSKSIDTAFADAIDECEYQYPSD